ALFAAVQRRFPLYSNIGAIRTDGQLFCAANAPAFGTNLSEHPFFQRALARREFTASGYRPDPTGRPVQTLSYPAIDRSGATWAVVFAEVDLGWLGRLHDKARLPAGTVIGVTDAKGLVLARYPDAGNWTGK